MRAPVLMIAIAITSVAANAAEPMRAPVQKVEQTEDNPPVVVASATQAPLVQTVPPEKSADPVKPIRHARATTCRCGDQTPSD